MIDTAQTAKPPLQEGAWTRRLRDPIFIAITQLLLSACLLLMIYHPRYAYEEDEIAKAAQVLCLARDAQWLHFAEAPDYYRKEIFSAYYLMATAFHKLTGLGPIPALNLLSVACGAVFLAAMPMLLRRLFDLPEWLSWIVLVNTPILTITFCYGNEAATAIALIALAGLLLSFENCAAIIAAAVFYGLATYSRLDYLLLGAPLGLLAFVRRNGIMDWKASLSKAGLFYGTSLIFGLGWLALVLRHVPLALREVDQSNLKAVAAFLLYSPNPVNWACASLGFGLCLLRRRTRFLLLFTVLLQVLPYVTSLLSPKYLLPSFVVVGVFAVIGLEAIWQRSRMATMLVLLIPWIVSVTPFGVFGPLRGPFWYVPTDDGPLPTGTYATFFVRVRQGFFQRRYADEFQQLQLAMECVRRQPERSELAGFFNVQSLRLWGVLHDCPDVLLHVIPFWDAFLSNGDQGKAIFMPKTGYLYPQKQPPAAREIFASRFKAGMVQATANAIDPFPDVIEIGPLVPAGSDSALGNRILFFNQYWGGEQPVRRDAFFGDLAGVSWIPASRFAKEAGSLPKPLYADGAWVAFSEPVTDAIYYSLRFPPAYSHFR